MSRAQAPDYIYLVRGKNASKQAWHCVEVAPPRFTRFKRGLATASLDKSMTLDVSGYGTVLHSGWGDDPPDRMVDGIDATYWQW